MLDSYTGAEGGVGSVTNSGTITGDNWAGVYIRANEFSTIVGKVRFGANGEWAKSRVLQVQYQGVKGTDIEQFRGPGKKVVLYPDEFKSGNVIYPFSAAQK